MKNIKTIGLCLIIFAITSVYSCGSTTTDCACGVKVIEANGLCTFQLPEGTTAVWVDEKGNPMPGDSSGSYPCPPYCYFQMRAVQAVKSVK